MLGLFGDPNQDVFSFESDIKDTRTERQRRVDFFAENREKVHQLILAEKK